MKPKRWVSWDLALGSIEPRDEEGKAAVGFLQVDEDEEGIGAGFDFEPSKQSNLASNLAVAGFLQVLGSKSNPAGTMFELGSISNPTSTGFRFKNQQPLGQWIC
ncbi:hypothetical protein SLEP1_g15158 [Rubroshorea leprosula]|uniref:Uncharacterized protein n=1 Tax=Rubroshorea leprosula TaxID=152421 RepID=A0AAV5IUA0_9ROSI|nr:hypothetical protein SLEP1_g15158 [Rubroshorea leprosula]